MGRKSDIGWLDIEWLEEVYVGGESITLSKAEIYHVRLYRNLLGCEIEE